MACNVILGDLTKVQADAIVFSANPDPICGNGIDAAVYEAAGHNELLSERIRIGKIKPGDAKATPALGLNARYLIHTVAPVWLGGEQGEYEVVRSCYEKSFEVARELGCKTVATSLIATGINGFDKSEVMKLVTSIADEFNKAHGLEITVVLFDGRDPYDDEQMRLVRDHILKSLRGETSIQEREINMERARMAHIYRANMRPESSELGIIDVKALLKTKGRTFRDRINDYLREEDIKASVLYDAAGMKRQAFSKMMSDENYHPSKYTIVRLMLAMKLNLRDALDFVESAGWSLNDSNKMDLVLRACIINKVYDVASINELLDENGLNKLENIK